MADLIAACNVTRLEEYVWQIVQVERYAIGLNSA